jgi:predicted transcriptional regulator
MTIKSVTFRIDSTKVEKLDALAEATERDRSFHINKAVDAYLAKRDRGGSNVNKKIVGRR